MEKEHQCLGRNSSEKDKKDGGSTAQKAARSYKVFTEAHRSLDLMTSCH